MSWGRVFAGVAALAGAGAGMYWRRKDIQGVVDTVILKLTGKTVAVLGPRESGKTTFLTFLSTGELAGEYVQTLFSSKVEGNRFKLADLKLNLTETLDVSGSKDAFEDWKNLYASADIGLYLVNAAQIERPRIERDLSNLESWAATRPKGAKLIIVVTHLDLVPGYQSLPLSEKGNFRDRFVAQHLDSGLAKLKARPPIVLGSLHDKQSISDIATQVIRLVTQ